MPLVSDRGDLHRWSLRFADGELERLYQVAAGAESLVGLRLARGRSTCEAVAG